MKFVTVARASDLAPGERQLVEISGKQLALYNIDGQFHAIDNDCPHAYGPLVEGELVGPRVTCPLHGWVFDVTSGACPSVPGVRIDTHPVRVEAGEVQVALD